MLRPFILFGRRLFFILPVLIFTVSVLSAGSILIHLVSDDTVGYNLADIDQIAFSEETLNVHLTSGESGVFDLADIDQITFSEDLSVEEIVELVSAIPIRFLKNYPNPFNPETTISFELAQESRTRIEI